MMHELTFAFHWRNVRNRLCQLGMPLASRRNDGLRALVPSSKGTSEHDLVNRQVELLFIDVESAMCA